MSQKDRAKTMPSGPSLDTCSQGF